MVTNKMVVTINGVDVHFGNYIALKLDIAKDIAPYLELYDGQKPTAQIRITITKTSDESPKEE